MFAANIPVISPLHKSDATSTLGVAHRLCLPPRIGISPTIHQLIGHTSGVTSAAFSPGGENIVSASWDNTVRVWSAETGELLQTLEGHTNAVTSAAFSPGGENIVSTSADETLRLWTWPI